MVKSHNITHHHGFLIGFYDLLNLRFQRLPASGRSGRVRYAASVAAGSYSVLAPVDPRFMLVVCIKVCWGIYRWGANHHEAPKKMLEMVENPDLEMDDDWG